ncbi:hypothetical protein ACFLY2_01290 [Patescibacteria group bacterium]
MIKAFSSPTAFIEETKNLSKEDLENTMVFFEKNINSIKDKFEKQLLEDLADSPIENKEQVVKVLLDNLSNVNNNPELTPEKKLQEIYILF